ncbi:MAG: hypothetical protein Q4F98_03575 [Lachnospiraceae bacterium]|nr:hypothetical protein [Lachnospiraceae bacterium]
MKIVDLLKKESIDLNGVVSDKKETIEKMVFLMAAGGNISDIERRNLRKKELISARMLNLVL